MKTILEKIRRNDFVLVLTFAALALLPILLKLFLNGLTGPSFTFYFFMIWIPFITLSLAMVRGWKEASLTAILVLGAILVSMANYPQNPAMDFHRQIVQQADSFLVVAALVSLALQIFLRRQNRT